MNNDYPDVSIRFGEYMPKRTRLANFGWQHIYEFPNGYGASLINMPGSWGLELAVTKNGKICCDTPITKNILGHLTPPEVFDALAEIESLKPDGV